MFLQVQSVVGPRVASTLHHGLNATSPWLQSLSRSKQGLPYLCLLMEATTSLEPAGKNGLLGLRGRTQLGKCKKARADALSISQNHDSTRLEGVGGAQY